MHRAGILLISVLGPGSNRRTATAHALSASEAAVLASALREDARDYYYSACSTLAAAVQGLNLRLYTWSTVKLYYSVFYALRADLAIRGYCIFYVNSSSFWVQAAAGAIPALTRENTHKSVLRVFETNVPTSALLSQNIGTDNPLEWLMARREQANYGTACFPDPEPPDHFRSVDKYGLRQILSTYLNDKVDAYTFDPDHAMLAFPLRVVGSVGDAARLATLSLATDETAHLKQVCRDASGPLSQLLSRIETP
jgi:hypothetical protein